MCPVSVCAKGREPIRNSLVGILSQPWAFFWIHIFYHLLYLRFCDRAKIKIILNIDIILDLTYTGVIFKFLQNTLKSMISILIIRYVITETDVACNAWRIFIKELTDFFVITYNRMAILQDNFTVSEATLITHQRFNCFPEALIFITPLAALTDVIRLRLFCILTWSNFAETCMNAKSPSLSCINCTTCFFYA